MVQKQIIILPWIKSSMSCLFFRSTWFFLLQLALKGVGRFIKIDLLLSPIDGEWWDSVYLGWISSLGSMEDLNGEWWGVCVPAPVVLVITGRSENSVVIMTRCFWRTAEVNRSATHRWYSRLYTKLHTVI